ncbi:endo-1,4-beta-xylanase A-like [Olea europaea subsp. europaea]|uniref:Endo-1,4-beta-xylanase A-like n=1 Tax=Olea europaea subsp. europaea TaxID=158383 RepID=A0A8S0QL12_OLEEU|nr:endo-1,4-beta-xylanase A-like [Olea europaea subsp. europaea]
MVLIIRSITHVSVIISVEAPASQVIVESTNLTRVLPLKLLPLPGPALWASIVLGSDYKRSSRAPGCGRDNDMGSMDSNRMCLTDNNFKNLATGDVVDKILSELKLAAGLKGATDSNGYFETSLFHGEYEAQISHPSLQSKSNYNLERFNVASMVEADRGTFRVKIHA